MTCQSLLPFCAQQKIGSQTRVQKAEDRSVSNPGGFTTVVDMPLNSIPTTTTPEFLDVKVSALARKGLLRLLLMYVEAESHYLCLYENLLPAYKCHCLSRPFLGNLVSGNSVAACNGTEYLHWRPPERVTISATTITEWRN